MTRTASGRTSTPSATFRSPRKRATSSSVGFDQSSSGDADLGDGSATHDGDAVAERERLGLVVGDVERGDGELGEEQLELVEQPLAQWTVERAERLVEEQHARLGSERSCQCDALLLAARERRDRALAVPGETDELEELVDAPRDLLA